MLLSFIPGAVKRARWRRGFVAPAVAAAATLMLSVSSSASAQLGGAVRFVRSNAPVGGNGTSWAAAYRNVFHALDEAALNPAITQVWIAQGTYTPNRGAGNRADTYALVPGVTLYGGFQGNETALAQRDPIAHPVTLSGDFNGNDGPNFAGIAENALQVLSALNFTTAPARIDGLSVRGGNANFNPDIPPLMGGGGLFIQSARVEIIGCTFTANSAGINEPSVGGFGGAVYNLGGDLTASDCLFTANRADNGGAIGFRDNNSSTVSAHFINCQFVANKAEHQTGGAVWSGVDPFDTVERTLTFTDCLFQDNLAQYGGAIIENNTKHVRLSGCTFRNNQALVVAGAIWFNQSAGNDQEPVFITRCTFEDNQGADAGGALFLTLADAVITNCEFLGNSAPNGTGGAIRSGPQFGTSFGVGDMHLANCTFTGNSAEFVGAVALLRNPIATIGSCTFAGNSAPIGPGGVFSDAFSLNIDNSIFWNNTGAGSTQAAQLAHLTSFGPMTIDHSCVQGLDGTLGGAGNIALDPMFVDLDGPDNIAGTLDDNVRPAASSPVIDAGSAAALPADIADVDDDGNIAEALPLDLADNARAAGRETDMGGFELPANVPGDVTGDGIVNVNDLLAVITTWGPCPTPPAACPADVFPDGIVNVNDLLLVITNWD